jgi:predicted PurR-regulated permease PerM
MDRKLVSLMIVFVLVFGLFTTFLIFNKPIANLTRAATESVPSSQTSLVFADPVYKSVKADGKDSAKIDVLVRSASTVPIANKSVSISTTLGSISSNVQTTNNLGRATFSITSETKGTAVISATVDGSIQLVNKVSVEFE